MPFNGSGGTSQPASSIYPAVASTLIESAKFNISIADIYTMLGSCIVKDGQQVTTARIPFASGIQTDSVTEKTADTGVTLDGVLLKDGRIDTTQGANITSAATINLETATGNVVDVTGNTGPITAVTLSQGHWRLVRFTGTPTLTNGASLVLPTAADYTCVAGDYILFIGYAAGVVRAYILPTSGPIPFVDTQAVIIGSADKTKRVRFEVDGLTTATTRVLTVQDADGTLATTSNKLSAFAATTSAELAGVISDETGSGALVFGSSPTLATPAFTGNPTGTITSDTYQPTITNTTNIDASTTATCNYMRVGNVVTVSGAISVDPTADGGTPTEARITLPIASNFSGAENCVGFLHNAAHTEFGLVAGNAAADLAALTWLSQSTTDHTIYFHFTYRII